MNFTIKEKELVESWLSKSSAGERCLPTEGPITDMIISQGIEFHRKFINYLKIRDKKQYIYLVTFTVDPKKVPDYKTRITEIEGFIQAQGLRTALHLSKYSFVREYTKKGVPHWHACVVSDKCLKKDRFQYYTKKYGSIDISKNKAQQTSEMLNYMSKYGNIVDVL